MKYTIVWNENKTEGIILSGDDIKGVMHAAGLRNNIRGGVSTIADKFNDVYEDDTRSVQEGLVPLQPTDEMIMAGVEAYYQSREVDHTSHETVNLIWQAMVQEMNK